MLNFIQPDCATRGFFLCLCVTAWKNSQKPKKQRRDRLRWLISWQESFSSQGSPNLWNQLLGFFLSALQTFVWGGYFQDIRGVLTSDRLRTTTPDLSTNFKPPSSLSLHTITLYKENNCDNSLAFSHYSITLKWHETSKDNSKKWLLHVKREFHQGKKKRDTSKNLAWQKDS